MTIIVAAPTTYMSPMSPVHNNPNSKSTLPVSWRLLHQGITSAMSKKGGSDDQKLLDLKARLSEIKDSKSAEKPISYEDLKSRMCELKGPPPSESDIQARFLQLQGDDLKSSPDNVISSIIIQVDQKEDEANRFLKALEIENRKDSRDTLDDPVEGDDFLAFVEDSIKLSNTQAKRVKESISNPADVGSIANLEDVLLTSDALCDMFETIETHDNPTEFNNVLERARDELRLLPSSHNPGVGHTGTISQLNLDALGAYRSSADEIALIVMQAQDAARLEQKYSSSNPNVQSSSHCVVPKKEKSKYDYYRERIGREIDRDDLSDDSRRSSLRSEQSDADSI
jgi:hypothetical protein